MNDDSTSGESPTVLEVGRILRSHGVSGDVIVELTADRPERVAPGVEFDTDRGPLTVAASRRHQGRWIVSTPQITSREAAKGWQQVALRAPAIDDPDTLWVHELIGCEVFDADGESHGIVDAVQDNPASDLLVLRSGALVPLRFVVGTPSGSRIDVDVPDGLFDLYETPSGE